ncbi:conserved hypothetical protein [Mesorhizobium escarrei]|uniref:Uncharacterized protein n=1 Tax=Mesorhizobium escarrei TaxID=666018 RepID=A0ABM9DT04_9HYPH|nr:conserved hypothetical protein [Mesorhizobium escarrei]
MAAKGNSLIEVSVWAAFDEIPKARSPAPPTIVRRVSSKSWVSCTRLFLFPMTDRRSRSFTQDAKKRTWCSLL